MTTAVLAHSGDCSSALSVRAMKCCSSSGSEFDGCAVLERRRLQERDRRQVAGRRARRRSRVRSYWWLAWSVEPIIAVEVGGRWWMFAVDA